MPATKIRLSFFAYNDGKEVNHTSGTTMVNDLSEALKKAKQFIAKHFPEAEDIQMKFSQEFLDQGGAVYKADSKTDKDMAFLLVISKL